jgi:cell division protein FtsN
MKRILIVVLVATLGLASCKSSKVGKKQPASAYKPATETVQQPTVAPVAPVAVQPQAEAPAPEPESSIAYRTESLTVAAGEDLSKGQYDFHVIVGSFSSNDNAKKLKTAMIGKGFSPVIMQNEAGMYRVSIVQTNSESEARAVVSQVRSKFSEHKDTWLLKKK